MTERGKELSGRLQVFCDHLQSIARSVDDETWKKILPEEQWPVGVTLRHLAAGHLGIGALVRMIVDGKQLPDISMEGLKEMANQHAREHADCRKQEVLDILEKNSADIVALTASLTDEQLDRTGYLAATGDVSAQQIVEFVVFMSAAEHIDHIKKARRGE